MLEIVIKEIRQLLLVEVPVSLTKRHKVLLLDIMLVDFHKE